MSRPKIDTALAMRLGPIAAFVALSAWVVSGR